MSSSTGTILRAFGTILILKSLWYLVVASLYFMISLVVGFEFDVKISFMLFVMFLAVRMFYPKNVFV